MTTFFKNLFLQFDTGVIYTIRFSSTSWFQICIYFDLFKVTRGHQRSLKGQNRRIMVETEPISRNIFKIHMFRLKILWRIQIQNYLRSNQVTKSHQRSNFGQNGRIEVKLGRLVAIYTIYICFASKFCEEIKFKIIWGQFRSSEVKIGSKLTNTRETRSIRRKIYYEHKFWRRISEENSNCYRLRSITIVKL